ncbi:MAG: pilus assembly protein [Hyphomicrobiales bacterium]|nr:pilus assembly protein [Hyphomicrobiales bacterium]
MADILKNFFFDTRGNVALITATLAVPLLFAAGGAADYTMYLKQKSQLQEAADSSALATTKEAGLTSINDSDIQAIAQNYIYASMGIVEGSKSAINLNVTTIASSDQSKIAVDVSYYWEPLILQYLNATVLPIKVTATAVRAGSQNLCVIALDKAVKYALRVTRNSSIQANNCAIFSNSSHSSGIATDSRSVIGASTTYSSGGYKGPLVSFKPKPIIDAPVITDPLIDRPEPVSGLCDHKNFFKTGGKISLSPGTYCGGIVLGGKITVTLKPGVYIIKNGPLRLGGNATMTGVNVGFFFEGNGPPFNFGVSTQISLTAPKTGPLAGILFFEQRSAKPGRTFAIRSKDAERFEGTIYLSKGNLLVEKASRLGQKSNWTAIIANTIKIDSGPQLVINSNYGESDIPMPEGIDGNSNTIRLAK